MTTTQAEVSDFLNILRESGKCNMFGAKPYVQKEFPGLSDKETGDMIVYWMQNFESQQ